jgi:hypothetical protein
MIMIPKSGGAALEEAAIIVGDVWGPVTFSDFPKGEYIIYAWMTVKNDTTKEEKKITSAPQGHTWS